MACRLFKLANMYDKAGLNSQKVLELAADDNDKKTLAEIKYLLADIQTEKSTGDATARALSFFEEASSLFSEINDECGRDDCKIGIVNVKRRRREFREALKDLDDLQVKLENSRNYDGMKKHLIEVFFQRGLILGMCGDKSIERKGKAAALLRMGLEFASRNGYPLKKSACLNALGLILFQESDNSEAKLLEAEKCLNQALELNIFCGLTRSCYQQYRNLGLIHAKMASLKEDEELKVSNSQCRSETYASKFSFCIYTFHLIRKSKLQRYPQPIIIVCLLTKQSIVVKFVPCLFIPGQLVLYKEARIVCNC